MRTLKILFLASEADPFIKVGGLGDVAGSLPRALQQLSPQQTGGVALDVRLMIPFHDAIRQKIAPPDLVAEFELPSRNGPVKARAYAVEANGVKTYLIAGDPFPAGEPVYSPDAAVDGYKYIFFSLAALELAKKLDWQPDILHANDWHTALAIYALRLRKQADPFFKNIRTVLGVHNLPFMGAGTEDAFDAFGLPPTRYPLVPWWGKKFPLVLGLQTADKIAAVSYTYSREILTPEYGCGLEAFLTARRRSITGIVNGLDMETWNPSTDPNLPVNFSAETLPERQGNKISLAEEFSLDPDPSLPLMILISRMDQQKGVDLVIAALEATAGLRWQAILLGTGNPELEEAARHLEGRYPGRIRAAIRFDAKLSRRMYAGADMLLMPSRYEPCGLAQMMAMRYGCVPLARATGGLQDTIIDVGAAPDEGTGFLFKPATAAALAETIRRALAVYADRPRWAEIQKRGMQVDFSWEKSAIQYANLYRELAG